MNREEALKLIKENVKRRNIVYHMLAVEAIMRALARNLNGDEELWGLTGLLHDLDFDKTMENPERHGLLTAEMLRGKVPREVLRAIIAHNYERTGVKPETPMEKALIASDAISGLIIACALVMPSKKLSEVKVRTIKRKFKDKTFARGARRDRIMVCEELGLSRDEFFRIALEALQSISKDIGL